MNTRQYYYLKKIAQAENTARKTALYKRATSLGSGTDFAADLLTVPGISTVGELVGLAGSAGTPTKDINPLVIFPGVGSGRLVQRRRAVDRERSGGKRDKSAKAHELAGGIVNSLLLGLGGAAIGGLSSAYATKDMKEGDKKLRSAINWGGAGGGFLAGTLLGYLLNKGGKFTGYISGGNKQEREEYLKGNNMWKNYLVPGYAGYQSGSGAVDALENT